MLFQKKKFFEFENPYQNKWADVKFWVSVKENILEDVKIQYLWIKQYKFG